MTFPSLSYNSLFGTVPSELAAWTSLEARLDLHSNMITPRSEQDTIDAGIIRRQLNRDVPVTWYGTLNRCDRRQKPAGRPRCSISGVPTYSPIYRVEFEGDAMTLDFDPGFTTTS